MIGVYVLLLLVALGLFLVAAFIRRAVRVNLVALGLACWVLVSLIQTVRALD